MADFADPMKPLPLDSIPREGLKINLVLDPIWLREQARLRNLGFTPAGPVSLRGILEQANQEFVFRGRLAALISLSCGRCLEGYAVEMTGPLEGQWRLISPPAGRGGRHSEEALEVEDLETGSRQQGGLDLAEYVLEQVVLNLPMAPLCREDCRGLCPVCGGNRNQNPCGCRSNKDDHSFKELKKLKF